MARKRKSKKGSKKGKSSRKGKDKGNWGKHMLGETDFYGSVPVAGASAVGAYGGVKGGQNLLAHIKTQYPDFYRDKLSKLGEGGLSALTGVTGILGHEVARRFSKPFFNKPAQEENFRPAIARFIKCLNEKNYAEGNKYLRYVLEAKLKSRMAKIGQKYN